MTTETDAAARPELAVAPSSLARAALTSEAPMLIVEGRTPRAVQRAGFHAARLLPRPTASEPALLLPLDDPRPAAYAIDAWSVADRRWKQARRLVARELAARRLLPGFGRTVTVATRTAAPPFMIAAAATHIGLRPGLRWILTLGQGDVLSRNVFHLFDEDADTPSWVVKFARVAGYRESFDRDQRGLELAAQSGPVVARRAPHLLGRFEHEGLHASVETAAVGRRLREQLQAPGGRRKKLELVDTVAAWVVEMARETASHPSALESECSRLQSDVLSRWPAARADLVERLPALPGVLQHNDLGSWNIVFGDESSFTALDWESARRHGLPLWDLFYFLADALATIDGASRAADRPRHTVRLFLGELPSSQVLFDWTRRAVAALRLPPEAVGPIATLCWLHHSLSHVARSAALDRFAAGAAAPRHGLEDIAALWLADPALAGGWTRWRAES